MDPPSEKIAYETKQEPVLRDGSLKQGSISDDDREVFKANVDGVEYRTVTWQRAIIIFIKTQIATGVLGIPSALYSLGAVGGGICVVGFQALNLCSSCLHCSLNVLQDISLTGIPLTDTTIVAGNFRNNHPECHSKPQENEGLPVNFG